MNHPFYQQPHQIHLNSHENLYQIPTDDQMKSFKVSELFNNQKNIESLSDKDLVEYCHNEWKLWISSILELKKCIQKEKNNASMTRNREEKKPVLNQQNKNDSMINFSHQNQYNMPEKNIIHPQFYQPTFQEMLRSQNLKNMQYMRNNHLQPHPPYMSENVSHAQFPFPFSQHQIQIGQLVRRLPGFVPAQMANRQMQMTGKQMKK